MAKPKNGKLSRKELAQARTLVTKIRAGIPIREGEWPADLKGPAYPWGHGWPKMMSDEDAARIVLPSFRQPTMPEDKQGASLEDYLNAMGLDEEHANPAAIYWHAYDELERGHRCESCGRGGPSPCRDCDAMVVKAQDLRGKRAAVVAAA
jgi:hypothetical protein